MVEGERRRWEADDSEDEGLRDLGDILGQDYVQLYTQKEEF